MTRHTGGVFTVVAALILAATGGSAAHADDGGNRSFTVSGSPIHGSANKGSAPLLSPGLYRDRLEPGDRYYRVKRSPGAGVNVSFTYLSSSVKYGEDVTNFELLTPEGKSCDSTKKDDPPWVAKNVPVVRSVGTTGPEPDARPGGEESCMSAPELVVHVNRSKGPAVDVEILAQQTPRVATGVGLPPAPSSSSASPVAAADNPASVQGGSSYVDAAEIRPGTTADRLRPGEVAFYRVRLDYGQSLDATLEMMPRDAPYQTFEGWDSVRFGFSVDSPMRNSKDSQTDSLSVGSARPEPMLKTVHVPAVTYLSAYGSSSAPRASLPGWYYLVVATERNDRAEVNDSSIPIRIHARVSGSPVASPSFADTQVPDAPEASAEQLGGPGVGWLVAATFGALALVAGAVLLVRSRRRA